mgnify:CR=1 FL=1
MSNYHVTEISSNKKTGRMPVTTSSSDTCPSDCPLKANGCYAKHGHLGMHWRAVDAGKRGGSWADLLAKVRKFDQGIWRHNQAGDLPVLGYAPGIMSTIGIGKSIQGAMNEN